MNTPRPDATAAQTVRLVDTMAVATRRLLATVGGLDAGALAGASALTGWTRATVVAHLLYGAEATARMLRQPPGQRVAFYPDGPDQREQSLAAADELSVPELRRRLETACHDLHRAAVAVPSPEWEATLIEPRLGVMARSRLIVLRVTEVEVHHADLGCGYRPQEWLPDFVEVALPLRLAWLAAHHRARPEADRRVNGTWRITRVDTGTSWVVRADGPVVSVAEGAEGDARDAEELHGEGWQLLAFLLGRGEIAATIQGRRFKRAFPGP